MKNTLNRLSEANDSNNFGDIRMLSHIMQNSSSSPVVGKYFEPSGYKGKNASKGVVMVENNELRKTLEVYEAIFAAMRLSRTEILCILSGEMTHLSERSIIIPEHLSRVSIQRRSGVVGMMNLFRT